MDGAEASAERGEGQPNSHMWVADVVVAWASARIAGMRIHRSVAQPQAGSPDWRRDICLGTGVTAVSTWSP